MAFDNTVLPDLPQIGSGEISTAGACNVTDYDRFEDGLVIGRVAQYTSGGIVANPDGTATPTYVGVVKRRISKEIEAQGETYNTTGRFPDSHASIVDFGRVTVDVTAAATPSFGDDVYVVNTAGADAGKVTQDNTGTVALPNATFFREIKTGVWEITIKQILA